MRGELEDIKKVRRDKSKFGEHNRYRRAQKREKCRERYNVSNNAIKKDRERGGEGER